VKRGEEKRILSTDESARLCLEDEVAFPFLLSPPPPTHFVWLYKNRVVCDTWKGLSAHLTMPSADGMRGQRGNRAFTSTTTLLKT